MRKVTEKMCEAFYNGRKSKITNTYCDGNAIYLHGYMIIERREDGVYITNAGWNTRTTNDRLNGLCRVYNVNVYHKNGQLMLNDNEWDGKWIKIN